MAGFILGSLCTIAMYTGWNWFSSRSLRGNANDNDEESPAENTTGAVSSYDLVSGVSQSGFLTELVRQLWPYINVAGCKVVKETVEPMFANDLPKPLNTLHFKKLDLGTVPLRLDNIVVHETDKVNHMVQFEVDVVWDGQCDIELKADYIGSLGVRHVKIAGRMSVILKPLVNELPIVQAVQFGFVNPPTVKIDFTGLAQVADLTIVDRNVRKVIQNVIQGLLVLPNRMMTRLDERIKFFDIYKPPIGVARITILRGRGFQVEKSTIGKDDIPDVFCTCSVGNCNWNTSVCNDSLEPVWNETFDVVIYDNDQILFINVFDRDSRSLDSDDDLGRASVTIGQLLLSLGHIKNLPLLDNSDRETCASVLVCADLCSLTTDDMSSIEDQKGAVKVIGGGIPKDQLIFGVVTIIVSCAQKLPFENEIDATCSVKVQYGDGKLNGTAFQTAVVPGLNPFYDAAFTVPIRDQIEPADITFSLYHTDIKKKNEETCLGTLTVSYQDVMSNPERTLTRAQEIGAQGAILEYQVKLSGLLTPGISSKDKAMVIDPVELYELVASNETFSSLEVDNNVSVKLTVKSGRGFEIEKRRIKLRRSDVPDCYIKVKFGPLPGIWRTETSQNTVNPIWNETKQYDNVHLGMMIALEVYDEDSSPIGRKNDDFIGAARVSVGKLLLAGAPVEIELKNKSGEGTAAYITLLCEKQSKSKRSLTDTTAPETNSSARANEYLSYDVIEVMSPTSLTNTSGEDMLAVTIQIANGRGFQVEKKRMKKDDVPDCYCVVKFDSCDTIWRTSTIKNSLEPVWKERKCYRYVQRGMKINIQVYDEDSGGRDSDDFLGFADVALDTLLEKLGAVVEVQLLDKKGIGTGSFLTLLAESSQLIHESITPPVTIASDNITSKVTIPEEFENMSFTDALAPVASAAVEPSCTNQISTVVPTEQMLATLSNEASIDQHDKDKSTILDDAEKVSMRLNVMRGRNFPIEKKKLRKDDIPDCYCKIRVGSGSELWRTATVKNDCNPVWDNQTKIFSDVAVGSTVVIEVWDEDDGVRDKDDFLGQAEIPVRKLIELNGNNVELALTSKGKVNGSYVTLSGLMI